MPAMVVNDNAHDPDKRGAPEPIAGKPAPTVLRDCLNNLFYCPSTRRGSPNGLPSRKGSGSNASGKP
ncbi:hypothetical protein EI969_00315 [Pseudomonas sp. PB101]|nr:hypothetical protein [Pseudomonas sp. PB101]